MKNNNRTSKCLQRTLSLIIVMALFLCQNVIVFADWNAGGGTEGDSSSSITGDFKVRANPNNGVRITVLDVSQGNKTVGTVNFLQKDIDTNTMYLRPYGWKGSTNGIRLDTLGFKYAKDSGVPNSDVDKTAWLFDGDVEQRVADSLGMKKDPLAPANQTDPNVLNQARYKLVAEPITEAYLGSSKYVVLATTSEIYQYAINKGYTAKTEYWIGQELADNANSLYLVRDDKELNIPHKGTSTTRSNYRTTVLGSPVGDRAIGILSFTGDVSTAPPPSAPPAGPTGGTYKIKKDYLNGTWLDTIGMIEALDSDASANRSKGSLTEGSPNEAQKSKYHVTEGDLGTQNNNILGTRFLTSNNSTKLMWSTTMNGGTLPTILNWLPKGASNGNSPDGIQINRVPGPGGYSVLVLREQGESRSYFNHTNNSVCMYSSYDLDSSVVTSETRCELCDDRLQKVRVGKDDDGVIVYGEESGAASNPPKTIYTSEDTFFGSSSQQYLNREIPKPKFSSDYRVQKFTLPQVDLNFYPSYKMKYHPDIDKSNETLETWMTAQGQRTLSYYPEVTITIQETPQQPVALSPWSRDKVDVDTGLQITKAGNAINLGNTQRRVTVDIAYYEVDSFYATASSSNIPLNPNYKNVIDTLSRAFQPLHIFSNIPLTGTIPQLNVNKSNLKFPGNLNSSVQKKSLTGAPIGIAQSSGIQSGATFGRSDVLTGNTIRSATTFNGNAISVSSETTQDLISTGILEIGAQGGWYKEDYEGLVKIHLTNTFTTSLNQPFWLETYRGVSDWEEKTYKKPSSPITYYENIVYGNNDYTMGYASYYSGGTVAGYSLPELKLYGYPCKPFGIRGSAFDQSK